MKKLLLLLICTFSGFVFATEYTVKTIPNPKNTLENGFVSNPDGILSVENVNQINTYLAQLEKETSAEVAVVVVNSIGYSEIKPFATDLFQEWGIGKDKQDNGLLILFVLDQKKVTFETGYGLEGTLPDAICKRIQTQDMIPEFKKGNYAEGLMAGVQQVGSYLRNDPVQIPVEETPVAWNEILPTAIAAYLLLCLLCWIWLGNVIQKIRKNKNFKTNVARYKAVKNQKAGIISAVSIMLPIVGLVVILLFFNPIYLLLLLPIPFTTIPANIYGRLMMVKIRREPMQCNQCDGKMHLLSEKKEDKYLKLSQQFEEQLHAVDYDVFVCDKCANEAIFTYDKPSAYSECPKCKTKAFIQVEKRTVVTATYVTSGLIRTTYKCKFCGYEENHNDHTPRLTRSSGAIVGGAAAGSIFSGGGGFSGGGSFGGGSSGGGGATSGW